MKGDMDLIRELLLKLETLPMRRGGIVLIDADAEELQIDGFSSDQVDYHLSLIREAGLIDSPGGATLGGGVPFRRLSWSGHDFLDSVRSPASAAGGFTVDMLVFAAKTYIEGKMKGLLGV
jgi:DNA-binding transcriptional ArsR family regulator